VQKPASKQVPLKPAGDACSAGGSPADSPGAPAAPGSGDETPPKLPAGRATPRRAAGLLLAALVVALTFVPLPYVLVEREADLSLSAILNYAPQHGLQFGTDIVSTYGPLGFLIFPCFSPHAAGWKMVTELGLACGIAAGLCLLAGRLRSPWKYLLPGVALFLTANIDPRTDLVMDLGLVCWGLLCWVESGRRLALCVCSLTALAVFGALAKVSYLFLGGLSVGAVVCDLLLRGNRRWGLGVMAGFGTAIVLAWIAAGQNLWRLGAYVTNGLVVTQTYSQTVVLEGLPILKALGGLVLVLAFGAVALRSASAGAGREGIAAKRSLLLIGWLGGLLWLVWKHGFVRADAWHMCFFFGFAPVLVLGLEVLPGGRAAANAWGRGLGLACCAVAVLTLQTMFFPAGLQSLVQPLRVLGHNVWCLIEPARYQERMNAILQTLRREAQLPRLRSLIGAASVDVFGQQQSYAFFNGLNYHPRPVPQSYGAANARLMGFNEQFYLSKSAPTFVLFGLQPIDRRFPPLEDARLLRDLLINYELVAAEEPFLLLRAKSPEPVRLTLLSEGVVHLGDPIGLSGSGDRDLWVQIRLDPSWQGRIREFFFRPPKVRLGIWQEPGQGRIARPPAPALMLAAGFLASPLLLHQSDVLDLYAGRAVPRPGAYSVEVEPGEAVMWQQTVRYRIFRIENGIGAQRR
jgi:hypothetical protein